MKHNFKDKSGLEFNGCVVIEYAGSDKRGNSQWKCKCFCGNEFVTLSGNIATKTTKSCGCLRNKKNPELAERMTTHGLTGDKSFNRWKGMMARCYSESHHAYKNYGGRGITVCDEWHTFENYLSDMGERPEGLTLDRIDNDKGYSKENCRWADMKVQSNNRRNPWITRRKNMELKVAV